MSGEERIREGGPLSATPLGNAGQAGTPGQAAGGGWPFDVAVTLIRAGRSLNGYEYGERVLEAAAPLFEGALAFCDHSLAWGPRSVRDVVGAYRSVKYEGGSVSGVLRMVEGDVARLVRQVLQDRTAGLPVPDIGLSVDIVAATGEGEGGAVAVQEIRRVNSVDVVVHPSAGGALERVLESAGIKGQGERRMENAPEWRSGGVGEGEAEAERVVEASSKLKQQEAEIEALRQARLAVCGDMLTLRLSASGLPEAARKRIAEQFVGRVFETAELEQAIGDMRSLVGALTGQATIQGAGIGRVQVGLGMRDRLQYACDYVLGNEVPDAVRESIRHPVGLRELFTAAGFDGQFGWEGRRIMEANEVTTAVMANIVGVSINKKLAKDYLGQPKWWKPLVVEVPLKDMREQERVRLNDFAALADVAENAAYANLAWDDAKETYTPLKRGNIVYVTLETIINDDMRAVQHIPKKLARAAGVTINEKVAALFTDNAGIGPAMACGHNVFDAVNHLNHDTDALAADKLSETIIRLQKQTDTASKRLGLRARWLLIPAELEAAAYPLCYSANLPGSANNDKWWMAGKLDYIVAPQLTDANNWYVMSDPAQIECIEVGYLDGRDTPELLVQNDGTAGTVFTNDAISYKVRWVFGCGWLDWRGAQANIVA